MNIFWNLLKDCFNIFDWCQDRCHHWALTTEEVQAGGSGGGSLYLLLHREGVSNFLLLNIQDSKSLGLEVFYPQRIL